VGVAPPAGDAPRTSKDCSLSKNDTGSPGPEAHATFLAIGGTAARMSHGLAALLAAKQERALPSDEGLAADASQVRIREPAASASTLSPLLLILVPEPARFGGNRAREGGVFRGRGGRSLDSRGAGGPRLLGSPSPRAEYFTPRGPPTPPPPQTPASCPKRPPGQCPRPDAMSPLVVPLYAPRDGTPAPLLHPCATKLPSPTL